MANFTLEAHDKGVNYVEYYHGGEKPYLVTTGRRSDNQDLGLYLQVLHSDARGTHVQVSFACFHPALPLIISGSEDGTVKLWHSNTYRLESTLDYGLERAWCVAYRKTGNDVALGYDEGAVVVKLGKEEPSVSMDGSGKVVWAKGAEVLSANLGAMTRIGGRHSRDGQHRGVMRSCCSTRPTAASSPSAATASTSSTRPWHGRNKAFGAGLGFAWASDSKHIRCARGWVCRQGFQELQGAIRSRHDSLRRRGYQGWCLLGVIGTGFVCFYDWETGALIRRIDVEAKNVSHWLLSFSAASLFDTNLSYSNRFYWSTTGELVAIAGEESFYVLRFDRQAYQDYLDWAHRSRMTEWRMLLMSLQRLPRSSELQSGRASASSTPMPRTGSSTWWASRRTQSTIRTNELYLLGYLPSHGRVYLVDKDVSIYSFALSLAVVEYQTAILRKDYAGAEELLHTIPAEQRNRVARFLESQDLRKMALEVSTDPDHKFDLAVSLDDFDTALSIAQTGPEAGSEPRWRTIGDKALGQWNLTLARECF
ncbi:hypothetical protein L7F22_018705 [Adiantum nelumboides]|nr:hypothetical protein [Adiantum nelumboides]